MVGLETSSHISLQTPISFQRFIFCEEGTAGEMVSAFFLRWWKYKTAIKQRSCDYPAAPLASPAICSCCGTAAQSQLRCCSNSASRGTAQSPCSSPKQISWYSWEGANCSIRNEHPGQEHPSLALGQRKSPRKPCSGCPELRCASHGRTPEESSRFGK